MILCSDEEYRFWFDKLKSQFSTLVQKNGEIHPEILPFLISIQMKNDSFTCAAIILCSLAKKDFFSCEHTSDRKNKNLLTHIEQEMDFQDLNTKAIEDVQKRD